MIGKTKIGRGFKGTLLYCLGKDKNPEILGQNGSCYSNPKELTREFVAISSENRNISKPVWHTSLSFAKEDEITKERMVEIANRFLEKAGFASHNHQFVIIKHNDTAHTHCHIVANRVGFDGKAVSDFYSKSRTVQYAKELENEYELVKTSQIAKDRGLSKSRDIDVSASKDNLKSILQRAISNGKVKTFDGFVGSLKKEGVEVNLAKYRKNNQAYGISYTYNGVTYKGSEIGKQFALKGISNHFGNMGVSVVANIAPTIKVIRRVANIISRGIDI
jgi:hypothetical protein